MPSLRRQRDPEGRMSLGDHLRELRNRITISAIAIVIGGVVGWIYYDRVINALTKPLQGPAGRPRRRRQHQLRAG